MYTQSALTIAGLSSSKQSITKKAQSIMATMPRLAAAPRRTSTAASADSTEAVNATANATGQGPTRSSVNPRMTGSSKNLTCVVMATSTADFMRAYRTLRNLQYAPKQIKAIHLGTVAAAMYICNVSPEVSHGCHKGVL
jgi:hypothetical protein